MATINRRMWWAVGTMVWAIAAAAWTSLSHRHSLAVNPIRLIVTGGFLVVVPGVALTTVMRMTNLLLIWVVGVGSSLTALTLGAQILLYAGLWSPQALVDLLVFLTVACASTSIIQELRDATRKTKRSHGVEIHGKDSW